MKYYNLDFKKLTALLLPTFMRKPRLLAYLRCIILPLEDLYQEFLNAKDEDHYKLDHTWQKCYMEKVLNDAFDNRQRRIKIVEGDRYSRQYIYTNAERKPKYLGTIYLRNASDFEDDGFDFTVDMANLYADWYDVDALVKFYKLEGTRFNIINLSDRRRFELTESIQRD
ncbi:MAG: hypothetical protein ACRC8Z_04835 [Empedobacter falsenii]